MRRRWAGYLHLRASISSCTYAADRTKRLCLHVPCETTAWAAVPAQVLIPDCASLVLMVIKPPLHLLNKALRSSNLTNIAMLVSQCSYLNQYDIYCSNPSGPREMYK